MKIVPARTIYLLLFVKVVSSEIIFEWPQVRETIGGEICNFRATSFEFSNQKFYLTLVDKDKRTPGVGYIVWFFPGEETSPKLNICGDSKDYRLFHKRGEIKAPMLIRADPCNDIWVMDANMYNISGEQVKKAPAFHIYEHTSRKRKFIDTEWKNESIFMNIAFEVLEAMNNNSKTRCNPQVVYIADASDFKLHVYHYHEDTPKKYFHPNRVPSPYKELPNGYPHILIGHQLGGIVGLTFVKTEKFGPLLLFHVLGGTTEYIMQLEYRKNESTVHEEDIRVVIEKGACSEVGRTAYDPATGTLFFVEIKTRKIGFLNLNNALRGNVIGPVYRQFDIGLKKGVITDMKVIGQDLWVLTSSESRITLEKEIIAEIIHERKWKGAVCSSNAVCELLECNQLSLMKSNSNELGLNPYILSIYIFLLIL